MTSDGREVSADDRWFAARMESSEEAEREGGYLFL